MQNFMPFAETVFLLGEGGGGEIGKLRKRQNIGKMRVGGGQFKGG